MENLVDILKKDVLTNADVLEILRRKSGEIIYFDEQGYMVFDEISEAYFMSAQSRQAADKMLDYVETARLFSVHEGFYLDLIEKRFSLKPSIKCNQALYDKNTKIEFHNEFEILPLDESHLGIIRENYKNVDDEEYIKNRIKEGMFGAFYDNELAGFIGKHAEGSIGLLHIFEPFRRRNIAYCLSAFMINLCLETGAIAYSQISVGNAASYGLHEKLGFSISEKNVYWLE